MKRIKRVLYSFLLAVFLVTLAGCSLPGSPTLGETETEGVPSQNPETESKGPIHRLPEDDPPPAEGMVRSILTNEWVSEEARNTRPLAVMIPNETRAIPHYNLSKASVLYEAKVEGSMTRMMGIYEDWADLPKIGNIRSLRSYFAYWAFEWDSVIVHYGGPYFIYDLLKEEGCETIDGMYDSTAFFRSTDRESPHNAYTSGKNVSGAMDKKGYSHEYRGLTDETHFVFAKPNTFNDLSDYGSGARDATFIDMTESFPLTRCYFQYDENDQVYYRSQYLSGGTDGPHMDEATGEQLSFSNVIVQKVKQEEIGDGYLAMQCHDTTHDGWFFTGGRGIHITWEKVGDYGATRYYDDNGYQITLNTGKTMILIIRDTESFSFR